MRICYWCITVALCASGLAPGQPPETKSATANLLLQLIRVNTSNPPGNTRKLDELLVSKFKPLGFDVTVVPTPDPLKTHFIARLKGDGSARPVLLAAHADVVGVERNKWDVDPFAGVVKGGYVYGRGALDYKGGEAVFAEAVMRLARNKVPLKRDVIFLAEADEESGKYNTTWLAQHDWKQIDCEFALNEGGWIMEKPDGSVRYVSISIADKSSTMLIVTAHGVSTHSSLPRTDNAIYRLARALVKLSTYRTKPDLIPSTREFFVTLARTSQPPMSTYFYNLVNSHDPALVAEADKKISQNTLFHAIMRNTIAPVFLNAGFRGNVIPSFATATLNVRTIPGTNMNALIAELKKVIGDLNVDIALPAKTSSGAANVDASGRFITLVSNAKPSSTDTDLYRALVQGAHKVWPGVPVTPFLFQAGTDALAWRSRGVPVYGIYPYPISGDDLSRMHGNNERMSIRSLDEGTEMIYRTLLAVAAK